VITGYCEPIAGGKLRGRLPGERQATGVNSLPIPSKSDVPILRTDSTAALLLALTVISLPGAESANTGEAPPIRATNSGKAKPSGRPESPGTNSQPRMPNLVTARGPVYDTPEKILAMTRCQATVVQRGPCFVYLKTADGKGFYIGSPGSTAEVGHFFVVLKDGHTYAFPEAFVEYQKLRRQPGRRHP
jgi:hypothetical protein